MRFLKKLLTYITVISASLTFSLLINTNVRADDIDKPFLQQIQSDTDAILAYINNTLPTYLAEIYQFCATWMVLETNNTTFTNFGTGFGTLAYWVNQVVTQQNATQLQTQITADMLGQPVSSFTGAMGVGTPSVLSIIPNINDLSYATMLGIPPVPNGPVNAYNYLRNSAGTNIVHTPPGLAWQGTQDAQARYQNYYNTVTAVESYNAYVLSNLLIENSNGLPTSTTQQNLVTQASNPQWLVSIGTEDLGKVIRELLLFQSQTYILLTQLVQTEKQILNASVMTNSLLIAINQLNESYLVSKAQGSQPTG